MRYLSLVSDYDGTLARNGRVDAETLSALERLLASGRKLILVTGRELDELLQIFPQIDFCEVVVAENGALLYYPASRTIKLLCEPPSHKFIEEVHLRGVAPVSVGKAIVATWQPHETTVLAIIRDLGLDLQVIFNKDAVMVLPAGVNKASGLRAALEEMQLSPHNAAAVGDAENDLVMLGMCECSAAVANALPMVKEKADFACGKDHGAGVVEFIDEMLKSDLRSVEPKLTRHDLLLGTKADGTEVRLPAHRNSLLVAGPSGSGKSTVSTAFLERLLEQERQFCVIDPEGDYQNIDGTVSLGNSERGPQIDEVLQLLQDPRQNVVVNLIGLQVVDRPPFFLTLLSRLQELRVRTCRPHWLIIDEAHHLLPSSWEPGSLGLPTQLDRMVLITVHPAQVADSVMKMVTNVVAVGQAPDATIQEFCQVIGEPSPPMDAVTLETGEVMLWKRDESSIPFRLRITPSLIERQRHTRKYAEGELPPDRSFYFRGPDGKFNLRAQNLIVFLQLAEGVDDALWLYHLQQGDYSHWFRDAIKDETLSAEAARAERLPNISAAESRALIKAAVEERYTLPSSGPLPMPGTDAAGEFAHTER